MSKYLPLFWDNNQKRAVFYRVYINIFGIFLRIPILPMGRSKLGIDFHCYFDDVVYKWPWKQQNEYDKWISLGFTGTGEFGDMTYPDLKSIRKDWEEYAKYN